MQTTKFMRSMGHFDLFVVLIFYNMIFMYPYLGRYRYLQSFEIYGQVHLKLNN